MVRRGGETGKGERRGIRRLGGKRREEKRGRAEEKQGVEGEKGEGRGERGAGGREEAAWLPLGEGESWCQPALLPAPPPASIFASVPAHL